MRGVLTRVVASENRIACSGPAVAALIVGGRQAGTNLRPPRRRRRIGRDRIELDELARRTFARTGHTESNRRASVHIGQNEAALVEMEPGKRRGSEPIVGVEIGAAAKDGIPLALVQTTTARFDPACGGRTEQLRDAGRFPGAKIQDTAPSGMPRLTSGKIDVDSILERHIRTENVEHVDLGRCRRGGVSGSVVVGPERGFVRMSPCVRIRDAGDGRVREDDRAVARHQIPPVEALAKEERVFV
jgi:hypothetical protein